MRRLLCLLLCAVLLLPAACMVTDTTAVIVSDSDTEQNKAAESDTDTVQPERDEYGRLLSFSALLEQYPALVGWVTVPGTIIDYPVVQCEDNDYYLTHDYKGDENRNGAVFADCRVKFAYGDTSRNVVIHAHHMKSGVMFANLVKYDDVQFYRDHPVVYFDSIYEEGEWVIFAIMKIDAYGGENGMPTYNFMKCRFEDDEEFVEYVKGIRERSIFDTYAVLDVAASDDILTLSTCSYERDDFRTVIVARRLRDGETADDFDLSGVDFAQECIMPESWGEWEGHL